MNCALCGGAIRDDENRCPSCGNTILSAHQVMPRKIKPRSKAVDKAVRITVICLGIGFVACLVGLGIQIVIHIFDDSEAPPVISDPTSIADYGSFPPGTPNLVSYKVVSSPPAQLSVDGRFVGQTPVTLFRPKGTASALVLQAPGYKTSTHNNRFYYSGRVDITLQQSVQAPQSPVVLAKGPVIPPAGPAAPIARPAIAGPEANQAHQQLSRQVILQTIQGHTPSVQACYERKVVSNPTLRGRVVVRINIEASGNSSTTIESSTLNDPEVLQCIVRVLHGTRFPPSNGPTTIRYPYIFHSSI